jgi:hypothetical protein
MPAPQIIQLCGLSPTKYPRKTVVSNYQVVQGCAIFDELERLQWIFNITTVNWPIIPASHQRFIHSLYPFLQILGKNGGITRLCEAPSGSASH